MSADLGVRAVLNARADEIFLHAAITGDPATRAEAERMRAAANGDIATARAELDRARAEDDEAATDE